MIDTKLFNTCIAAAVTLYGLYRTRDIVQYMHDTIQVRYQARANRKKYKGYYGSAKEKDENKNGKSVLLLFHGTECSMWNIPRIDYINDNIYTVDRDPSVMPTYVGDAIKLDPNDILMRLPIQQFHIIVIPLCECHILDQILDVGLLKWLSRIVDLLAFGGFVYFLGFDVFRKKINECLTVDILNDLGLRVPHYSDIKDARTQMHYTTWNVFIRNPNLPPMTDTTKVFEPQACPLITCNESYPTFLKSTD